MTVTDPSEASRARDAGADALVVQGVEAGGHRGGWTDRDDAEGFGLLALLRLVAGEVDLPLVATGGIADGAAIAAVLVAGASAAQLGTAFMLAPRPAPIPRTGRRSPATPPPRSRGPSRAGRPAACATASSWSTTRDAVAAYPEIHHATSPLRAAARAAGDPGGFNLWAGQAHRLARAAPAGDIVAALADEARAALRRAG